MIGAAIGSTVLGALNYGSAKSADRKSASASNQANALADQQWAYQQDMFSGYQDHMAGAMDFVGGMSFGGAGYTAEMLDPEKYTNQEGIDVAQKMMDSWTETFGGLEENLSDYYNNLDPDKFAMSAKSTLQANLDKSMTQFNESMAASGLQSSGMKQQVAKEAMFAQAQGNAQIDINSPEQVAQMQQGFLNYGSGFKTQAQSLLSNATNIGEEMKFNAAASNQQATNSQLAFNANASNQASAARSSAMLGAFQMQGNTYLQGMNMQDPRIAMKQQEAQNYGASSAGYMGAAGTAFGSAMSAGMKIG